MNRLNTFWSKRSLVTKYSVVVSGLVVSCVALLGVFYYGQFRNIVTAMDASARSTVRVTLQDSERGRADGLAAAAQRIFAEPLASGDLPRLQNYMQGLADRQDLGVLRVTDMAGRVLHQTGNDIEANLGRLPQIGNDRYVSVDDNILVAVGPIRVDGQTVGYFAMTRFMKEAVSGAAQIDTSFDAVLRENQRRALSAIILAAMIAMICGILVAMRVARRLTSPVRQLAKAADRIRREDFDHELKVEHNDDIGELFKTFNAMSRALALGRDAQQKASAAEIARLEAEQASEAKTSFLANMSHEIRTPMNGIMGMAQMLDQSALSPKQRQQVDVIMRSGDALIRVINDVLDISKLQAGQVTILSEPFDLRHTVEDVMALLGHTAREKGIELIGDMPISVRSGRIGDEGRVRQVLINLVGNAIKFTQTGSVQLLVRDMPGSDGLPRTCFDVIDTGIGIAEDKFEHIFNHFEQADNTTTRQFGGTGLGLAISRELTAGMGGSITVKSQLGEGSTFRIEMTLPIDPEAKVSIPAPGLTRAVPVLVVEDHPTAQRVLSEKLARFGAKAVCVADAGTALTVLMRAEAEHGFQFPLVITDYGLPGMNGLDFVRQVRATPRIATTRFLVLCSVGAETLTDDFAALDVHDLIEKPYPYESLAEVLMSHLADNQLDRLKSVVEKANGSSPDSGSDSTLAA